MKAVCCVLLLGFLCLQALGQDRPSFCNLPADPGTCKARIPRYYYNSQAGACLGFIYGGCGGNNNRFVTIEACKATCYVYSV